MLGVYYYNFISFNTINSEQDINSYPNETQNILGDLDESMLSDIFDWKMLYLHLHPLSFHHSFSVSPTIILRHSIGEHDSS